MKTYNYFNRRGFEGTVNNEPSLTVPDQVQTLADMLRRVNNGFPLFQSNNQEWLDVEDEEPFPQVNDLTDIDEQKNYIQEVYKKAKQKTQNSNKTNEEAKGGGANVASEAQRSAAKQPTNAPSDE